MSPKVALSRFTCFGVLGTGDVEVLLSMSRPVERFERGQRIRQQGERSPRLYLLHSGWAMSSLTTRRGDRQVLRVHLPGDLVGLPSMVLAEAHDTITAISAAEVSAIEPTALKSVFEKSPRLAAMLFAISQEERVILMDRLLSIGQMEAPERIAAFVLELRDRIIRSGQTDTQSFQCPLTQQAMADLLGLTPVHLNRTLQSLRAEQTIAWSKGTVTIKDEDRLHRLVGKPPPAFAYEPTWMPEISGNAISELAR